MEKKGINGGAWSLESHKGRYYNNGICEWIMRELSPKKILDFGCGSGLYCNHFSNNGANIVHGIEPEKMDENLFNPQKNCIQFIFDITKDKVPDLIDNTTYDLVFSLEVMEHIDRKFHDNIFDFLCKKTNKYIVFSGARIGQLGFGHIACRDELDWRNEIIARDFEFSETLTNDIRSASNKGNINHCKNLQVFLKK